MNRKHRESRHIKDLRKVCRDSGATLEIRKIERNHEHLRIMKNEKSFLMFLSHKLESTDPRAWKNNLARLKRFLREADESSPPT